MTTKPPKDWLSENETALIFATKALAQLLIDKGVAKPEEVDSVLLIERDRFAARGMTQGAAILEIVVQQRQRDGQSASELSPLFRDLPKGSA